jgi:hypothetical protein
MRQDANVQYYKRKYISLLHLVGYLKKRQSSYEFHYEVSDIIYLLFSIKTQH